MCRSSTTWWCFLPVRPQTPENTRNLGIVDPRPPTARRTTDRAQTRHSEPLRANLTSLFLKSLKGAPPHTGNA